ncbi:MAG TPA: aryl-sulfate sulfotransferase [Candidatus Acidoferrum sp.]|nr:aryl-sulfate sulfotransferase [Candidatus Acidoferrum sp.]
MHKAILFLLVLGLAGASRSARAVTILSGPSLTANTNAPLAALLQLTTDVPARITVSVSDGTNAWQRRFYNYGTTHAETLLGFKPASTNTITVTVYDRYRNQATAPQPLQFVASPLPTNFPTINLLQSQPDKMEPGYTLFNVIVHKSTYWYVTIVDSSGQVVWYDMAPSTADVRFLDNGDLFMPWKTNFIELNLLGQIVNSWLPPTSLPIDVHDGVPTGHGTILYLSDAIESVTNYPVNMTDPHALRTTATISYQKVVELSATNASLLHTWSPISVLDPERISYLISLVNGAWDSEHSNAIIEDPSDDSLIVSMRHQNAVVKIARSTGQLRWILGPPANWGPAWQPYLLQPVGSPFVWHYGQHSPIITPQGTLILFDDGNYRASPYDPGVADTNNYSRAVEYSINEQTMQVSQVWDYGRTNETDRLFVNREGNAEPEPKTGNVLIDFAAVSYVNGAPPNRTYPTSNMVRITEVTHDAVPQIVFDLAISAYAVNNPTNKDCSVYRCHRIPDLYGHPALPVADLTITCKNGLAGLEFSADDFRTYVVEASTNLADWEQLGTAVEDPQNPGDFSFQSTQGTGRYYRVLTQ